MAKTIMPNHLSHYALALGKALTEHPEKFILTHATTRLNNSAWGSEIEVTFTMRMEDYLKLGIELEAARLAYDKD